MMYINAILFILLSSMKIWIRKSIHICFSLKKGRCDTASCPEYVIAICQYIKHNDSYRLPYNQLVCL